MSTKRYKYSRKQPSKKIITWDVFRNYIWQLLTALTIAVAGGIWGLLNNYNCIHEITPKLPLYQMPQQVKGCIIDKVNTFAEVSLENNDIKKDEQIILHIEIDKKYLNQLTPFFLSINKEIDNCLQQIMEIQYDLKYSKNVIKFHPDLTKGKYALEFGTYFKEDIINNVYPRFYRKNFI